MTGQCLVVANQTLGGEPLDRAIEDCIQRGVRRFYVVVPMTPLEHEEATWRGGFGLEEYAWMSGETRTAMDEVLEEDLRRREEALDEARARSQHRLDLMIDRIQAAGGEARGEVGSDDPVEAAQVALETESGFEEIIVSTLPSRLSRWLRMGLPDRVARMTDIPVITVEAPE